MIPTTNTATPDHDVAEYNKQKLWLKLAGMLFSGTYLTFMGLWGGLELDHIIQPFAGGNRWVEVLLMGVMLQLGSLAVCFPVNFWTKFVVEHRFGLSTQSFKQFMLKWLKLATLMLVFAPLLLTAVYSLLWFMPTWWWLAAALMMIIINGGLGMLLPVVIAPLFYKVTPVADTTLLDRFRRIAAGTDLKITEVSRVDVSVESVAPNACMAGMSNTKRVLLWDTLLASFPPEELDAIFAHELGHYKHGHLLKMLLVNVVVMVLGFLVGNEVLNAVAVPLGHASISAPSSLALFLLALSTLSFVAGPIQNFIFRRFEYEADWDALDSTENVAAFHSALFRLVEMNKLEMSPPPWKVFLFDSHPSTKDRLDKVREWMESRGMDTDHITHL